MTTNICMILIVILSAAIVATFRALDGEWQINRRMKPKQDLPPSWSFTKAKSKESGAAPLAPTNK